MLSKSKGQILCTAAVLHALFQIQNDGADDTNEISGAAMIAAIDFVQTIVQHTAYIADKETIASEVEKAETSKLHVLRTRSLSFSHTTINLIRSL